MRKRLLTIFQYLAEDAANVLWRASVLLVVVSMALALNIAIMSQPHGLIGILAGLVARDMARGLSFDQAYAGVTTGILASVLTTLALLFFLIGSVQREQHNTAAHLETLVSEMESLLNRVERFFE